MAIEKAADEASLADAEREASINVVFHVPGTVWSVDFEGEMGGRYAQGKRLQVINVAVPRQLDSDEAVKTFLTNSLLRAVELGGRLLAKRGASLSVTRATNIARQAVATFAE